MVRNFKAIKDFIAEDSADKALETVKEIYHQLENIQQFSFVSAALSKCKNFKMDYKYVIWGDYAVIYKVSKDAVEIYQVVNRYQDITRVLE